MPRLSWARALLLSFALAASPVAAASPAEAVLSAVNSARAKAGCQPLRLNSRLTAAAKAHAKAMAEQNFFGHAGKDGTRFSS
ncbi:MAG TPA: CAP domain-containing protein, partial [Tabrizicola sp.]|nr:CAP domain-containing protein [Tabrizicola sp.]